MSDSYALRVSIAKILELPFKNSRHRRVFAVRENLLGGGQGEWYIYTSLSIRLHLRENIIVQR